MSKSLKQIMRAISPEILQRELRKSQRNIDKLLTDTRAQLLRQANATFGDKTWAAASWPEFGVKLIAHGQSLVELGVRLSEQADISSIREFDNAQTNASQ